MFMPGVWFLWSKKKIIIFQKEKGNTFTFLIMFVVKSVQKEQNSTNLLSWTPKCRNKRESTPKRLTLIIPLSGRENCQRLHIRRKASLKVRFHMVSFWYSRICSSHSPWYAISEFQINVLTPYDYHFLQFFHACTNFRTPTLISYSNFGKFCWVPVYN